MSHVRLQCRDAIVAAVTGLATTGSHVVINQVYPLETVFLPAIVVRLGASAVSIETRPAPRLLKHLLAVHVIAAAESNSDVESVLSEIAAEIDVALAMPAVVGPWKTLTLIGDDEKLDGTTDKVKGQLILTYQAEFYTKEGAPGVAL